MKNIFTTILTLVLGVALVTPAFGSDVWPASDSTGTQIAYYTDASGIIYHERLGTFFIVTNAGCVKQINISGTELSNYCTSSWTDFEGIAVADYDSNYLYLGLESPQAIYEFDISTNNLTGKSWTLSGMSVASGSGLEGLEYANGYFYAASQYNGIVYSYSVNLSTSGAATFVSSFYPYSSYTSDLAALSYSEETNTLYSLYDSGNRLVTTEGDGTYINRYQLPSGTANEEGIVVVPNCPNSTTNVIITEDSGRIMLFSGFPIDTSRCATTTTDADGDGVSSTTDCNDADATVSANQTYYVDSDRDGYGSTTAASICSATAPTGYSSNNTDCSDSSSTVHANQTYYRDADGDGKGSATVTTSVCSATAPSGYVTNITDSNDSDYDNDGVSTASDCNDSDSTISTNRTYYVDSDLDGYGSTTTALVCALTPPTGYSSNNTDCSDVSSTVYANQTYYRDYDGDGLGAASSPYSACSATAPAGYVTNASDANDSDYDNDGVSSSSDCNDSDSTISANQTYYQDYDGDGLGNPAIAQSICSLTVPTGYVTNASDTDDSGIVTPTYSQIEYDDNGIDDDGDGSIDEVNTLTENGVHPVYGTYDPSSTSLYSSTVTSITGSTRGRILVKYVDNSVYQYQILSTSTIRTTVTSYGHTGYLLVKSGNKLKYALVNAYTGEVVDSTIVKSASRRVRVSLAKEKLRVVK
ncbi:MAG: PKD protein [uncultured bacterium]|nr:MAG: PKD protein [uncultured bacterium]